MLIGRSTTTNMLVPIRFLAMIAVVVHGQEMAIWKYLQLNLLHNQQPF